MPTPTHLHELCQQPRIVVDLLEAPDAEAAAGGQLLAHPEDSGEKIPHTSEGSY
jgi:hypothetical protein